MRPPISRCHRRRPSSSASTSCAASPKLCATTIRRLQTSHRAVGRRNETPFSSIEVELPARTVTHSISDTTTRGDHAVSAGPVATESADRIINVLQPVRVALDCDNRLRFDVHIKMCILFLVSSITFIMKYIPFLPLLALVVVILVLNRGRICLESQGADPRRAPQSLGL
jgi:hypothetical protein